MTPAQHYAKAQDLLKLAPTSSSTYCLQAAAVHAQLALVGATVLATGGHRGSTALDLLDAVTT